MHGFIHAFGYQFFAKILIALDPMAFGVMTGIGADHVLSRDERGHLCIIHPIAKFMAAVQFAFRLPPVFFVELGASVDASEFLRTLPDEVGIGSAHTG